MEVHARIILLFSLRIDSKIKHLTQKCCYSKGFMLNIFQSLKVTRFGMYDT